MDLSKLSDGQLGELEAARGDLTKLSDATLAALSGEAPTAATPPAALPPAPLTRPERTSDWIGSRLSGITSNLLGAPRATADFNKYFGDLVGVPALGTALNYTNPITLAGQFLPSTEDIKGFIKDKIGMPDVKTPGKAGHLLDAGVEAVVGNAVMPGSFLRNAVPTLAATALSEGAGEVFKGSKYEPLARLLAGAGAGVGAAGVQNAAGSVAQGVKNTVMPNPESVKIKAIARALERDQTTGPQFTAAHADLGPGAMAIEAGGPNMRGMTRAAVSQPGVARTMMGEAFDNRVAQADGQTLAAINQHVSDLPPVSTRTNTIGEAQRAAATPAYEAAGIPHPKDLTFTEATRPGEPVTRMVPILPGAKAKVPLTEPGPPVTERTYNTPTFDTPALQTMLKDSGVTREAINAVRNLSAYKYLPENSMAMLDKSYKHLVAMESDARRAGQGTRANDIKLEREKLLSAITEANPKYQAALDAFSGPQGLIDAAKLPEKLFKGNVHSDEVGRQYKALTPDQQAEFRGGLADYLRTAAGSKDTGVAAQRIWGPKGDNQRARIEVVLGDEFPAFAKKMENQVNVGQTRTDINAGSRTAPLLAEMADGMNLPGMAAGIATGHPLYAMAKALGTGAMNRISTGASEKSNAAIAKALTSSDPQSVGLVAALAEKQRLTDLLTSRNRKIALGAGAASPMASGSLAEGLANYQRRRASAQ
jgi:hypothetical protein